MADTPRKDPVLDVIESLLDGEVEGLLSDSTARDVLGTMILRAFKLIQGRDSKEQIEGFVDEMFGEHSDLDLTEGDRAAIEGSMVSAFALREAMRSHVNWALRCASGTRLSSEPKVKRSRIR